MWKYMHTCHVKEQDQRETRSSAFPETFCIIWETQGRRSSGCSIAFGAPKSLCRISKELDGEVKIARYHFQPIPWVTLKNLKIQMKEDMLPRATKPTCSHHVCRESTESNTASYRAEMKWIANSQQVLPEVSRELGEELLIVTVDGCKDPDIQLTGLRPLTTVKLLKLIWQVFLTFEGSVMRRHCWKWDQELVGQEQ